VNSLMTERNQVSETLCMQDPRWTVSKMIITLTSSLHLSVYSSVELICRIQMN